MNIIFINMFENYITTYPSKNKFLYTSQSSGYDAISGAKATGKLKEAEEEAEASTGQYCKTNMKSHKGLHIRESSALAKKSSHITA